MSSSPVSDLVRSLPNARQLEDEDFNQYEPLKNLTEALLDDSQRNEIIQLTGDDAALVIECLDKIISSETFKTNSNIQTRSRVFSVISRLSRRCRYLPRSYLIDPETVTLPDTPYTSGTCAEVYCGTQNGTSVAVKVLRTSVQESPEKLRKNLCQEAILWKHVSCPYILQFGGVFYRNGLPAIVTPWMPHGNITEYLEKYPDADRLRLLVGAVKGVKFLHNCNIAHGDLKGPNVLISNSVPPRAILADFGFTRVATGSVGEDSDEQGTKSFMSPELLLSTKFGLEKGVPSKEADIYALGMTVYQVLTGKWPFYPKRETELFVAVISGERPPKPGNAEQIGMTDAVWALLVECWREDRATRPNISDVLRRVCDITGERRTTDSTTGMGGLHLDITRGNRDSIHSGSTLVDSPSSSSTFATSVIDSWKLLDYRDVGKKHKAPESPQSVKHHCFPPWKLLKEMLRSKHR